MGKLWYERPAGEWEEALPIGNGRMGAMVFGGIENETLQVNEESIWYGGKTQRINPDFRENLPLIRRYLEEGQIRKAEKLMDHAMTGCPDSMHPYQTLGEVLFTFSGILTADVKAYQRSLELDRAVTVTELQCGDTLYRRELFASKPADGILMRFTAEGSGTVDFTARMRRGKYFDGVKRSGNDRIELYGNLGRGGYEFSMTLSARVCGCGEVNAVGECLTVKGAKEVILCFTADTTYHYTAEKLDQVIKEYVPCAGNTADTAVMSENAGNALQTEGLCPAEEHFLALSEALELPRFLREEYLHQAALQRFLHDRLTERLSVLQKPYAELLEEHIRDYSAFYKRCELLLKGAEEYDLFPTDVRLERAAKGKADIGLDKLLFDFGRYLTIACSRAGGLPSTLQGLWNKDFMPPWDSKYTININTEMNYWHVESCNLPECHEPLFALLEKVQKTGRRTAREMYGCRGFVAHHNTDIHGDSAPQDIWYPGSYWTMGAAWIATHLWTHYLYTQDKEFLKRAFPVLAESSLFFVDFLIERNGYLVTSPSVSPENSYRLPSGETGSCCIGATMDNQILRHLFTDCLEAWDALGGEAPQGCRIPDVESIPELMKQIAVCRERLMPTRISESGRILEWQEDYEEVEPGHRHISHLYGLYPAGEITVDQTPELAAAARKTLEYRLSHGGGHTGWSRAWIMNHYACLRDGEAAHESIEKMLGQSTYPNLFDKHPPFQIDGNFGACAAICNMLVQSSKERTILLPALPKAWNTGYVRGLKIVGNAEVNISWENGHMNDVEIHALSDYDSDVIYGEKTKRVTLAAGERMIIFA